MGVSFSESRNKNIRVSFKDKLHQFDTEEQTFGCRHSNPEICGSNHLPNVCAFTNNDGICRKPSKAWKKQYYKLKEGQIGE